MKRKLVSLVLCACLVAGMFPAMALADNSQSPETTPVVAAETPEASPTSGQCGDNLTWTYDQETQTLTISGTGDMWDYNPSDNPTPWSELSITQVIVEAGVTSIGDYVFYGCTSLTSVTLPEGLAAMGIYAFWGCAALTEVILQAGLTTIEEYAFYGCESLTNITLPEGVTSIGACAFDNCTSLTDITLPNGVTTIGVNAFYNCTALTEITIPESVTNIGAMAFSNCSSLTSITIPEGVTTIGHRTFVACTSLAEITIPESVTSIGAMAFVNCSSLTSITIPTGVTTIEEDTFNGCASLSKINLPEGLTSIGRAAFNGCASLTEITIPEGVASIGENAFTRCRKLNTIFFGGTTEEWEALNAESMIYNPYVVAIVCADGTIPVAEPKGACGDDLTWSYDWDSKTLTITGTGDMWDYDGTYSDWADFEVSYITLEKGITSIGNGAFQQCFGLERLVIPEGVTSIGDSAIYECTNLTEVTIPNSVTLIGYAAFYGCNNLTTVNYTGTQEQWAAISVGYYNEELTKATIHYNYDPDEPIPTPTPEPTPEPTPAPQDKVDIPVSGDKAEATVGRVDLVLNNAGTVFAPGTVITVEAITQGPAYDTAKKALSSTGAMMDSAAVLEFTATRDGKPVQPDGSLSVTFSIPSNLSPTNLKLFYVSEDGQYQEIPITVDVDARTATAELSHFSTYVLANIAPATGGGQGSDTSDSQVPPTNEEPVPPTGDTSALTLYVCILTMAMAGLSIVLISKRKA